MKCVTQCFILKEIIIVHKKICCGVNMYRCETCGKMYKSKKSLYGHRRKHHTDDVCCFTFSLWRM